MIEQKVHILEKGCMIHIPLFTSHRYKCSKTALIVELWGVNNMSWKDDEPSMVLKTFKATSHRALFKSYSVISLTIYSGEELSLNLC